MSKLHDAELVIYNVLAQDRSLGGMVALLHTRLKDIDDYRDMLPGVGIKATGYKYDPDTGEEYAEGFCEVVAAGEYDPASQSGEEIGDAIFQLIKAHEEMLATDTTPFNGMSSSGYQSISGAAEARFVCITHVFWRVWF